ncbi:MAG: hypothetical protein ACT4OJ_08690 [Bacteroidota bacterium]
MRLKVISWVVLFFSLLSYTEARSISNADTTGKKVNAKEAAFLEQYGKDEVSKKVIRKYFANRRNLKWAMAGTFLMAAGSGIGLASAASSNSSEWDFFAESLLWSWGLFMSGIAFLLSLGFFFFNSPKRLIKVLDRYHATGKLPKRYRNLAKKIK